MAFIDKSFDESLFQEFEDIEIEKGAVPVLIEIDSIYQETVPNKYFITARSIRISQNPSGHPLPEWTKRLKYNQKFCLITSESNYDRNIAAEQEFFKNHLDKTLKRRQVLALVTSCNDKKADRENEEPPAKKQKRADLPEIKSKYEIKGYFNFKYCRCPRAS